MLGAGAWGTALAKVLADAGNEVRLWARRAELADEINDTHRNTSYLGDAELPKSIHATSDPGRGADAVPAPCFWRCPRRHCGPTSSSGPL